MPGESEIMTHYRSSVSYWVRIYLEPSFSLSPVFCFICRAFFASSAGAKADDGDYSSKEVEKICAYFLEECKDLQRGRRHLLCWWHETIITIINQDPMNKKRGISTTHLQVERCAILGRFKIRYIRYEWSVEDLPSTRHWTNNRTH